MDFNSYYEYSKSKILRILIERKGQYLSESEIMKFYINTVFRETLGITETNELRNFTYPTNTLKKMEDEGIIGRRIRDIAGSIEILYGID